MRIEKLKPLVNSPAIWMHFMEWVDGEEKVAISNLTRAKDTVEVYRAQGYLNCLTKLKRLKDDVNAD